MKENMTRKQEALWVLRLAAILLILLFLLDGYNLTPSQAIRQNERVHALPDTELLSSETTLLTPLDLLHLSVSRVENTLLLTPARFSLLSGWQPMENSILLELESGESSTSSWWWHRGNRAILTIFGFVPEGKEVPTFTVTQYRDDWDITTADWAVFSTWEAIPTELIETEQGTYFMYTHPCRLANERATRIRIYTAEGIAVTG